MQAGKLHLQAYFETLNPIKLDHLHESGIDFPAWHLEMLTDRKRLEFYKELIEHKVKDKIVLDIGAGSGILSYLALKFGAKKVYSVEFNPYMQVVYSKLLAPALAEGRAELLDMDANDLTLEFFGANKPEVVIHEIYGANGLSEDVIAVFKALKSHGILENAKILPQFCDVVLTPTYSEIYDKSFDLKEFEGFPIDLLSPLGAWCVLDKSYDSSDKWTSSPEEHVLVKIDLQNPEIDQFYNVPFEDLRNFSHIRLFIRVKDENKSLSSSHATHFSHWHNLYFPIPKWHREKALTAVFEIVANKKIFLNSFTPNR